MFCANVVIDHRRLPPHRSLVLRHDDHLALPRVLRLDVLRRGLGRSCGARGALWDLWGDYGGFRVVDRAVLVVGEEVEDCDAGVVAEGGVERKGGWLGDGGRKL